MSNDRSNAGGPAMLSMGQTAQGRSENVLISQLTVDDLPVQFGRYELQSILGEGGMARVFRAELHGPAGFRKPVAVKVIKPETGGSANEQEAMDLIQEACLGGRLKHPHIVDVYELGDWEGNFFISMELVDGVTLSKLIRVKQTIPSTVVLEIGIAMAEGLAKAHAYNLDGTRAGLVHRDLKPSNILLSWDGEVKIADFGIAITKEHLPDIEKEEAGLFGTPDYMSPEQVMGYDLDGRSDLFALSLVIAKMVLGKNPLGNRQLLHRLCSGEALESPLLDGAVVDALDAAIPGLGALVLRCLEPDPEKRMPNATCLVQELEALQVHIGHTPRLVDCLAEDWDGFDTGTETVPEATLSWEAKSAVCPDDVTTVVPRAPSAKGNLGPPRNAFVGRGPDLDAIEDLFRAGARLVTVKGAGGAGKTRVSRSYARRVASEMEGGTWFVDLTEASSAMGVLQATALALGVPLGRAEDVDELVLKLGQAIAGRGSMLLVLDNFEQVADHAPSTVGRWMELASNTLFLATSRESLRLDGEHLFSLESLREEDAVELFGLRAEAAGARIAELRKQRAVITRIVKELDGLPLAIELAAARCNLLSPAQLLARLSERFALLHRGWTGGSKRQTSLRSLIDWSWDLLEPWEQSALVQLSAFRGGFTMEAAEVLLDLSPWSNAPWSLDVVGSLLDKSLLYSREALGQPRFGMYVSIRAYAEGKLALEHPPVSGKEVERAVKIRHATLYAEYGSEAFRGSLDLRGGLSLRRLFVLELENLTAGVDAALELGDLDAAAGCALAAGEIYRFQGPVMDGVAIFERVLARPVSDDTRFALLKKLAWLRQEVGDRDVAVSLYHDALAILRDNGDRRLVARVKSSLAETYRAKGEYDKSLRAFEHALSISREFGERRNEGLILGNLALLLESQGRVSEALDCYQQALAIHREFGILRYEASVLGNLGNLFAGQGKFDEAYQNYQNALVTIREIGDRGRESMILGNIANEQARKGQFEEALKNYEEAIVIAREFGNPVHESTSLGNLGDMLFLQGDYSRAEQRFTKSIALADPTRPYIAGVFRGSLALMRALQGDISGAQMLLVQGEPQVRGINKYEFGKFLCKKARVLHLAGQLQDAHDALRKAEAISDDLDGAPDSELNVLLEDTRAALSDESGTMLMPARSFE